MKNRKELSLDEMEQINGGFVNGELCTVTGTKNFLALRSDDSYKDSNIVEKLHNGDNVVYFGSTKNGYAVVKNMDTNTIGFVNEDYII